MKALPLLGVAVLVLSAVSQAQVPDLGPVVKPVDQALGQVVPPVLNATYTALGQNITREDVRMWLWVNLTKGDVNFLGLTLGAGRAEVQAAMHGRLEMRVISSDRIRAAAQGENAYNVSAENATFLSTVYLPAEVFRATLAAETIAAFQRSEEDALAAYLREVVPEMDILALDFTWSNVSPTMVADDASLTEPPIVLELDLVVQYLRIESVPSLLNEYFDSKHDPEKAGKKAYIKQMKHDNGTPLQERDFFGAAAYTQLLNLSMQPGWSLDILLHLPRGYSFTYFNEEVESDGDRSAKLHIGGDDRAAPAAADGGVHKVFLASITHRKMVAFALLVALWGAGLFVAMPMRFLYARYRLPRMKAK
ncbi:MAG: hypothetical protein QOJ26_1136 [Thermoplasmata archaeon]|nr:hypothetical protein [Thermoplasmata archaeon]MEA3166264.1 hypothetical protein [Thermoplasmata archaeon]